MSYWVVVYVWRGLPDSVEAFPDLSSAQERESELRKTINLEDDETGVFEIKLELGMEQ